MRFSVRWLKNHQLRIEYGKVVRIEGPGGAVTFREAAKALGTYYEFIRKMAEKNRVLTVTRRRVAGAPGSGPRPRWIPMSEVYRLRTKWRRVGKPTIREEKIA